MRHTHPLHGHPHAHPHDPHHGHSHGPNHGLNHGANPGAHGHHAHPHLHHPHHRHSHRLALFRFLFGRHGGFWGGGEGGRGDWGGGQDHDGFGGDDDGWRRGRKFSAEDLQLLLLSLLEEKPSHGYELIKALETRTNGFYKPSPGVVYPALTFLEDLGYATVDAEGNKKRYQLSDPGRAYLEANRERVTLMVGRLRHVARKMDWMRRAMSGAPQRDPEDGGWLPEFVEARMRLKRALTLATDAAPDEQRRIAAILAGAAEAIENKG